MLTESLRNGPMCKSHADALFFGGYEALIVGFSFFFLKWNLSHVFVQYVVLIGHF